MTLHSARKRCSAVSALSTASLASNPVLHFAAETAGAAVRGGDHGYIFVGIWLEERDLVEMFGDEYRTTEIAWRCWCPGGGRSPRKPA